MPTRMALFNCTGGVRLDSGVVASAPRADNKGEAQVARLLVFLSLGRYRAQQL